MAWWKCRVTWTGGGFTDGDGGTKEEAEENLRINVANDRLNNNGFNNVVSRECSLIVDDGGILPPSSGGGGSIPLPPIITDVFHLDLLFYDATAGEAELYRTDKGNLSLLKKHTGFRKTWQLIVSGSFGGGSGPDDLLFYDATAGEAEFYKTDSKGNLSLLKKHTGFRKTWQAIVPGNFGGRTIRSDLLFYDATTGEGEFYKIDDAGNLSLLKKLTGFRKTWQAIVPGDF